MVAVFGVFVAVGVPSIQQIGVGTAVAIALDATLVRLILVPAAMELLGDWNWYLPRPLARILPRTELRVGGAAAGAVSTPISRRRGRRDAAPARASGTSARKASITAGSNWRPALGGQLVERVRERPRRLVGALGEQRVEHVGHGADAGGERDRLAREAVRVARAVPALVVRARDHAPRAGSGRTPSRRGSRRRRRCGSASARAPRRRSWPGLRSTRSGMPTLPTSCRTAAWPMRSASSSGSPSASASRSLSDRHAVDVRAGVGVARLDGAGQARDDLELGAAQLLRARATPRPRAARGSPCSRRRASRSHTNALVVLVAVPSTSAISG